MAKIHLAILIVHLNLFSVPLHLRPQILVEALKTSDNIAVQVSAVNALASVGGARAAEVLAEAAADEAADPYVRESATSALSRLQMVATYTRSDS
jgi:bilin biosynthesis protein